MSNKDLKPTKIEQEKGEKYNIDNVGGTQGVLRENINSPEPAWDEFKEDENFIQKNDPLKISHLSENEKIEQVRADIEIAEEIEPKNEPEVLDDWEIDDANKSLMQEKRKKMARESWLRNKFIRPKILKKVLNDPNARIADTSEDPGWNGPRLGRKKKEKKGWFRRSA